jgi:hypothetical protein
MLMKIKYLISVAISNFKRKKDIKKNKKKRYIY